VAEHRETESQLVERAQQALSNCSWTVGECAALWTKRHARGRTDADFGALIGLSGDQVYQRRRVWESYGDVREKYAALKWSHFYSALTWDDAAECLQWANEMQASIAEMKAWRRAQRGEDLAEPSLDEEPPFDPLAEFVTAEQAAVRPPNGVRPRGEVGNSSDGSERAAVAAGVARQAGDESDYAPFGKGARGSAPTEAGKQGAELSSEQVFKRLAAALEKCDQALTPSVLEDFGELPVALQQRFLKAVKSLSGKAAGLK
jgi:hypothetical protein